MKDHKIDYDIPHDFEWGQRLDYIICELKKIGTMGNELKAIENRDKHAAQMFLDKYELSKTKSHQDEINSSKSCMKLEELIGALVYVVKDC